MLSSSSSDDHFGEEILKQARQITVFPNSVEFPPTFTNVLTSFTVYFSNPFHAAQTIKLTLEGDEGFSISQDTVEIEGGSVYSCVISFKSKNSI